MNSNEQLQKFGFDMDLDSSIEILEEIKNKICSKKYETEQSLALSTGISAIQKLKEMIRITEELNAICDYRHHCIGRKE